MLRGTVIFCWAVAAIAWAEPMDPKLVQETWRDPAFQKQFLGSYGFQAELEPKVSPIEKQEMEKILPLLSTDLPAAAQQLEAILKPDSSAVLDFTLGNIYFQQDKLDKAATHFQSAITKFPTFRRAHKNLALIQVRQNHLDQAIKSFSKVLELGGGDGFTYGLLAHACASEDQYLSAEFAYRNALLLQPDTLNWKLGLARCILKQQKYAEAAALFAELIDKEPDRLEYWLLQANAYIGMKEPMKAAQNFEIIARMGKAGADHFHTLGDIYVNENILELAGGAYLRALNADPKQDPSKSLRAAEILVARGAMGQAKALLAELRKLRPDLEETSRRRLLKLEARMAVADGKGADSAKVLEEIVKLDPLDGEALMLLAQHYSKAGQTEKACFYYERASGIEKFEADAKVCHAQLLVSQSKFQDAVPLLKRAQELKPRVTVAKYLEQVERILKSKR